MELDTEVDIEDIFDEDWDAIEEEEDFDGKLFLVLIFLVFRSQVTIISKSPPMILVWDLAERLLWFSAYPGMILLCEH